MGLKFYTKISAIDLTGKISSGIKFRTTGLFRKRNKITGSVPVYNTSTNNGTSLGVEYRREKSDITGTFTKPDPNNSIIEISYDGDYKITANLYIKVEDKIFKIDSIVNGNIILKDTSGLLTEGSKEFTVLEAKGVGISDNNLQVIPNEDGVYQPFRDGTFENLSDNTTQYGQPSVVGPTYADIMSFDTKDGDTFHEWKTGNNIYFSQIILL